MDVLPILATIFGIVGAAGGAVGYFAKGRGDSIIAYQAKEIELLKSDNFRLENSNTALTTERDSLLRENETLKGLAQGSPQLKDFGKQLKELIKYLKKRETSDARTKNN